MFEFIATAILILIFSIFLFIVYKVYNKLMFYNNELINNYSDLYKLIEEKFNIVDNGKMKKDVELEILIKKFRRLDNEDDVINISLDLDKLINKSYKKRKFYQDYKNMLDKIDEEKKEYNNNVLRYNNLIKMFPVSIISNLFGFELWLYYRND